jgi:hypothetical protein
LSRLGFTLAETNDGLEVNLVGEDEDDLEPSLVIVGFLAVFSEGDDDFGLEVSSISPDCSS